MSLSQFDQTLERSATEASRAQAVRIKVGGPLKLDPTSQYSPPFVVHFVIIQGPEQGDHTPANSKRVSGIVTTDGAGQRWDTEVDLDLEEFRSGPARGIGVAVLEKKDEFAYETLTWCDHVQLDLGGGATAA